MPPFSRRFKKLTPDTYGLTLTLATRCCCLVHSFAIQETRRFETTTVVLHDGAIKLFTASSETSKAQSPNRICASSPLTHANYVPIAGQTERRHPSKTDEL